MKSKASFEDDRQYWLWVTTPQYYLDEHGNEPEDLEPTEGVDVGGWWTCSKHTKRGDWILVWRARGASDLKYLIQAESDAYPIADDPYAEAKGWDWGCDYRPLFKFQKSITLQDLRNHPRLQEWNALRAQFRSRCMRIGEDDWHQLSKFAAEKNPSYGKFLKSQTPSRPGRKVFLEEELEDALVHDLGRFKQFGYDLELFQDEDTGNDGRQYVCVGSRGRIDLLCRNKRTKGFTIIELKNVQASRHTLGQICQYLGYLQGRFGKRTKVDGIVVSRGYDIGFQQAVKTLDGRVVQIDLQDLRFE